MRSEKKGCFGVARIPLLPRFLLLVFQNNRTFLPSSISNKNRHPITTFATCTVLSQSTRDEHTSHTFDSIVRPNDNNKMYKAIAIAGLAALAAAQSSVLTFTHVPNPITDGQAQAVTYSTNDTASVSTSRQEAQTGNPR